MRIAFMLISVFAVAAAQDAKPRPISLTGLVVDTGCYLSHDTKGEKHIKCATACAKAGVPLAILEEKTGTVYLVVAVDHKNPNEKLMPFIEKRVAVTGTLFEKGGVKGVGLKTVAAAE
ncbi:MAG: hypothetical protein FJW20_06735 [Acidimicrobiia bacterium]|nr:hypothetical protein [Acidimicrobiia bacterium]